MDGLELGSRIRELSAEAHEIEPCARPYLDRMAREGPGAFIDNAPVEMCLLYAWDTVLPIVVVEPAPGLPDVCSPVARFAGYPSMEVEKRGRSWVRPWLTSALRSYGGLMRACRAERSVYVNNWMLATNPAALLSVDRYRRLNTFLQQRYPAHAIVYRTVNPHLNRAHFDALQEAGARMVCCRVVYVVDPAHPRFRRRSNVYTDRRHLRTTPYRTIDVSGSDAIDTGRLAHLYRSLYLEKHCGLNAAFNARFFDLVLRTPLFRTHVFMHGERIDGFSVTYTGNGCITSAIVGYDVALPQSLGLYRLVMMHTMLLAERGGTLLNLSGGAAEFKILRGAFPVREYDAVFDSHLPPWRRLPWHLVSLEGLLWRVPALQQDRAAQHQA